MSERTTAPFRVHRPGWVDEFRAFIVRGNVIDLAVGIILRRSTTYICPETTLQMSLTRFVNLGTHR